jgi:hypothetical protein
MCHVSLEGILNLADTEGYDNYVLNKFLDPVMARFRPLNITYVTPPINRIGICTNATTREYDGCIGSLQKNESDFAFVIPYLEDFGPNVQPLAPSFSDYSLIGSVYHKLELDDGKATRVLDFVNGYSVFHWMLTAAASLSLFMLMMTAIIFMQSLKEINKQTRRNPVESVVARMKHLVRQRKGIRKKTAFRKAVDRTVIVMTSCVLFQHSNCSNVKMNSTMSWIYTFLTVLCFFTGYFLTSMIKTEMVALDYPPVYESYQDILDNDTMPIWTDETDDQRFFRDAANGTVAKQIWDRALNREVTEKSVINYTQLMDGDFRPKVMRAIIARDAVTLVNRLATNYLVQTSCATSRQQNDSKNVFAYVSRDVAAKEEIRYSIASSHLDLILKKKIVRVNRLYFESHLPVEQAVAAMDGFLPGGQGMFNDRQQCMASIIIMPPVNLIPVPVNHYRDLILLFKWLVFAAAFILGVELLAKGNKRRDLRARVATMPGSAAADERKET